MNTITFWEIFRVIALFPVLFLLADLVNLVRAMILLAKKKAEAGRAFVLSLAMLLFLFMGFNDQLLPTVQLIGDLGAEPIQTQGTVSQIIADRGYDHNNYYGTYVIIDGETYYALTPNEYDFYRRKEVSFSYLPHSRIIVSWS